MILYYYGNRTNIILCYLLPNNIYIASTHNMVKYQHTTWKFVVNIDYSWSTFSHKYHNWECEFSPLRPLGSEIPLLLANFIVSSRLDYWNSLLYTITRKDLIVFNRFRTIRCAVLLPDPLNSVTSLHYLNLYISELGIECVCLSIKLYHLDTRGI